MKNVVLVALALIAMSNGVKAQDSFYEGVAKVEGTKFQEYIFTSAVPEKEGYYHAENPNRVVTFKTLKTEKGNYCGLIGYEEDADSRGFVLTDEVSDYVSYSKLYPGLVAHKYTKVGYVFIDDMLITLEGISDGLTYKRIGRIFLIKQTEEEAAAATKAKEEAKANMSMKEKIAAAKDALKNGVKGTPSEEKLKSMKLDEVIKTYLNAMNEKHLAGDKSKEAAIDADIKAQAADFLKLRQEQSRELSKTMEAKKAAGAEGGSNYTIKNNSGASMKIITDSGSTTTLSSGGSTTYICSTDVYYCVGGSSKGSLIANGDDACGSTVTIE